MLARQIGIAVVTVLLGVTLQSRSLLAELSPHGGVAAAPETLLAGDAGGQAGSVCGGNTGVKCQSDLECFERHTPEHKTPGICLATGIEEGGMCGGIAGLKCRKPFVCRQREKLPPGAADFPGVCVNPKDDKSKCATNKDCEKGFQCKASKVFHRGAKGGVCVIAETKPGHMCGGIAGITCEAGYECKLRGHFPDASGFCMKSKLGGPGSFCGGFAGIQCSKGNACLLEGNFPDAGGKCVSAPIVNSALALSAATKIKAPGKKGHPCEGESGIKCEGSLVCLHPPKKKTQAHATAAVKETAAANGICVEKMVGEEGGLCEGFAGIKCGPNLKCAFSGAKHPDAAGICVPKGAKGAFCGGIANIKCKGKGFFCEMEGDFPDAGGVCVKANDPKKPGGVCGGIAGFTCPPKFTCHMTDHFPDAMGICVAETAHGDFCGGFGGIQCKKDFACVLDGDFPDAGGHCISMPMANNK